MAPASPPAALRRTKKPSKKEETNPAIKALTAVVAVCLVAVLLTLWPSSSSTSSTSSTKKAARGQKAKADIGTAPVGNPNEGLETFFEAQGIKFNGASVLCTDKCRLIATRHVKQGEPMIQIPQAALIDPRFINETKSGQACFVDEAAILKSYAAKEHLGASFANLFQYAFYFAMEKRDAKSSLAGWLAALPQTATELPSALAWNEDMDECLDSHVANEAKAVRGILAAAVEAAAELCDVEANKEVCGGNPPTEEELRWAFSVYLHYNFQDQAILLGANFAQTSNARSGIVPQFDQANAVLNMVAENSYKRGESIVVNFARGPGTLLVSQGFFDSSSRGVDARIRIPDASEDPMLKKFCAEKYAELMFGQNGRPLDALVNCIGLMVSNEEQRNANNGNFKSTMKKDKDLRMYTFGNLTGLLQTTQKQIEKAVSESALAGQCDKTASPLAAHMYNYREFVDTVVKKNVGHCAKTYYSFDPPVPTQQPTDEDGEVVTGGSATISADTEEDEAPMEDAPETP